MFPYFDLIINEFKKWNFEAKNVFLDATHWWFFERFSFKNISNNDFINATNNLTKNIIDISKLNNENIILDVWCWFWWTIRYINEKINNSKIYWINIDENQLEIARKNTIVENWNIINFLNNDACNISINEKYFNNIILLECIFHFSSREKFFGSISKYLVSWSKIILTDFVPIIWFWKIIDLIGRKTNLISNFYWNINIDISVKKYEKIAEKHWLKIIQNINITKNTLPTYDFLLSKIKEYDFTNKNEAILSTKLIKIFSKLWIVKYRIILFEKL